MLKSRTPDAEAMRRKIAWALDEGGASVSDLLRRTNMAYPSAVSEWRRTGRVAKKHLPILADITGTQEAWWLSPDAPVPPTDKWRVGRRSGSGAAARATETTGSRMAFARRLQDALTAMNFTPANLADRLQIPIATVNKWLKAGDTPTAEQVLGIVDAFASLPRRLDVPLRFPVNDEEFNLLMLYRNLSEKQHRDQVMDFVRWLSDAGRDSTNIITMKRPAKPRDKG